MKRDIVVWVLLFIGSIFSLYTYSTIYSIFLLLFAVLFISLYCGLLWLIKNYGRSHAKYFFAFLFIVLVGLLLDNLAKRDCILTDFLLGTLGGMIVLVLFHALPFIEGWTRGKALFTYRNLGFHHWFWGSLVMPIFVFLLPFLANVPFVSCFKWLWQPETIAFSLGFGLFWFTSQIPEIFLTGAAFPVEFRRDC